MTYPIFKIKDFCQVGDGAHASIKRESTGIMYLTSKNFKSHGLDLSILDYINQSDYEKHFKVSKSAITTPSVNDVLLGIIGSIGVPYIVKEGDLFGISSSVAILRAQQGINANYLFHFMKSSFFQQSVDATKSGAAQGFLSLEMIRNLPLIVPEENLQQQIASILTAYDDLIETNNQRIATLEQLAQQIYKEWFVRLRFPNWENTPLLHGIPEGWGISELLEFGKVITGKTPSTLISDYYGGDFPFIKTPDMHNNTFICQTDESLTIKGIESQMSQKLPAGSICTSCIGTCGVVSITTKESMTNQQIHSLVIKNETFRVVLHM